MLDLQQKEKRVRELKSEIIYSVNKRIEKRVEQLSLREKNLLLNDSEYAAGKVMLESTPEGVGIGAHYLCNSKCIFCLGGKPKLFSLARYKDFFEPRLGHIISKARYINFCGFGEVLLMPEIEKFLEHINKTIPKANKIFTTNGSPLKGKVLELFTQSSSVVEISLHASRPGLHKLLTRMDNFEQIVSQIKQLISMRKYKTQPTISLVFLVTALNIEDLPHFVEFAANLGADEVFCNYMVIFHPAHLKLSCFFKQEITNAIFNKAKELAKSKGVSLRLPPMFGAPATTGKVPLCSDPWKYFYVENEGSVVPCCFAGDHFGYLDNSDFETIWNGANYKHLRRSLTESPAHEWCRYCYKYKSENVNDIRSHISFRPGIREKVLRGYK